MIPNGAMDAGKKNLPLNSTNIVVERMDYRPVARIVTKPIEKNIKRGCFSI